MLAGRQSVFRTLRQSRASEIPQARDFISVLCFMMLLRSFSFRLFFFNHSLRYLPCHQKRVETFPLDWLKLMSDLESCSSPSIICIKGYRSCSRSSANSSLHVPVSAVADDMRILRQAATPRLCQPSQLTVPCAVTISKPFLWKQSLKRRTNPVGIFSSSWERSV